MATETGTPTSGRKSEQCRNCSAPYKWNGKLSDRHTIACPGSQQPPTEEIMSQVEGTCSECGLAVGLVLNDTRQCLVIDHLIKVGDCCAKPSKPEKMMCLVCKKEYVLRGDGKCRYHFISNECTGSNLQPSPDYTTPGEGDNKFGACPVCKLPRKLKSSNGLVQKHSAPKIYCEGSGLTTEEMKIAMEVKKKNPDPADVDAVAKTLGATSISDKKKARSPK